jgi:hypothetical protein
MNCFMSLETIIASKDAYCGTAAPNSALGFVKEKLDQILTALEIRH